MASKKELQNQNISEEYPPRPRYRPTRAVLIEGPNLARASAALKEQITEVDREKQAAVEETQSQLALVVTDSATALARLAAFQSEHEADIKMLRELSAGFDNLRGQVDEAIRNQAANRIAELMHGMGQARDVLSKIESRVDHLTFDDLIPRVFAADRQFPGILDRDGWLPRIPTHIRLDVFKATKRVEGLPAKLRDAKNAVEQLAAAVEKSARIRERKARITGVVKKQQIISAASIVHPDELKQRAEGRPEPAQTVADSTFSGYEADNIEPPSDRADGPLRARPGESMADYKLRANRS